MVEKFRKDVRDWLEQNAPESLVGTRGQSGIKSYWGGHKTCASTQAQQRWLQVTLSRGWTAPTWPSAYGGAGLSSDQGRIIEEEIESLGLPRPLVGVGLTSLGPVLLSHGTDQQKKDHLSKIASGRIRWCRGYSALSSSPDLVSISTRAVCDGDELIVNGQKVWAPYADVSDWIFCLVQSNPEDKWPAGLTFVLIDMNSPGVTTQRVRLISGESPFCETSFDQVRVPLSNVVGELNKGWAVAKSMLCDEDSKFEFSLGHKMSNVERDLIRRARRGEGSRPGAEAAGLTDPMARVRIASWAMQEQALHLTIERLLESPPSISDSMVKVLSAELEQHRWELAMELMGHDGWTWDENHNASPAAETPHNWLRTRGNTMAGETKQKHLERLARRFIGLTS